MRGDSEHSTCQDVVAVAVAVVFAVAVAFAVILNAVKGAVAVAVTFAFAVAFAVILNAAKDPEEARPTQSFGSFQPRHSAFAFAVAVILTLSVVEGVPKTTQP